MLKGARLEVVERGVPLGALLGQRGAVLRALVGELALEGEARVPLVGHRRHVRIVRCLYVRPRACEYGPRTSFHVQLLHATTKTERHSTHLLRLQGHNKQAVIVKRRKGGALVCNNAGR